MTILHKAITRQTRLEPLNRPYDVAVTMYPDATIGFRRKGFRHEVRLSLSGAYLMALKLEIAEKKKAKKGKKT